MVVEETRAVGMVAKDRAGHALGAGSMNMLKWPFSGHPSVATHG